MDDCLVIGGGVVGLSIAYELASHGLKCTLLDRDQPGKSASWAGAGILPPASRIAGGDSLEQLRSLSHSLHPEWARRLTNETGIDTGFRRCGGIYLARTAAELATLSANELWWGDNAIEFHRLTRDQLRALEPAVDCNPITLDRPSAWLLPDECQLRNPRHLQALVAACQAAGVRVLPEHAVLGFNLAKGGIESLKTDAGEFSAGHYCVASGSWSRQLLEQVNLRTGVMPIRGQMLLYKTESRLIQHVVNDGHRYLVPRDDGYLLAGSNEEEVGYVIETTDEMLAELRTWAESILPALRDFPPVKTWAGLRPGSFDTYPYIGRSPTIRNLLVATGHFRAGLHLSCGTAVLIRQILLDEPPSIDLRPFRVNRG